MFRTQRRPNAKTNERAMRTASAPPKTSQGRLVRPIGHGLNRSAAEISRASLRRNLTVSATANGTKIVGCADRRIASGQLNGTNAVPTTASKKNAVPKVMNIPRRLHSAILEPGVVVPNRAARGCLIAICCSKYAPVWRHDHRGCERAVTLSGDRSLHSNQLNLPYVDSRSVMFDTARSYRIPPL